jgi:hypothetical protein
MAEMAVFRGAKAPFFGAWSSDFSTQAPDLAAFMSADFFGAPEQEKWRAPFLGEDLFRHDAQRPFTPKRYLIASSWLGPCPLLLLRQQMDQHVHGGRLSQPRSGDIIKPGGVSPRFSIPQNTSEAPEGRHWPPALSSAEIAGLLADVAPAGAQENTSL